MKQNSCKHSILLEDYLSNHKYLCREKMRLKFILKGDVWHMHCFFALMIFTDDETEAQDNIVTREKLTNYIQESSKKAYFIIHDFFYISHEPRHHFVVQKITTHILTPKQLCY